MKSPFRGMDPYFDQKGETRMATVSPPPSESRTVLNGVPWRTYVELRENPDNDHLHMTYDRGTLEIMSPSAHHGGFSAIIALTIAAWTDELDIPVRSLGQMTCQREDLARGLEPDKCFYVQSEPRMWNKIDVDLAVDPPPDLAIEVETSRSSVQKMPIYAALGVPELWRYDGQILRIYELVDGQYQSREASACFPNFPVAKVEEVLRQIGKVRETMLMRGFRQWVQENFVDEGT
jgi:Uma2 family endonuclease